MKLGIKLGNIFSNQGVKMSENSQTLGLVMQNPENF